MEMGSGDCAAERGYIDDVIMPHPGAGDAARQDRGDAGQEARQFTGVIKRRVAKARSAVPMRSWFSG
jgi:hypothetical protein